MDVASASSSTPNAAAGVATAMSAHQASTSCLFRIMQYGLQHEHVTSRQHICQSSFPQGQATHRRAPLRTLFNERTASLVGVRPRVLPVFFRASSAGAQYEERGASEEVRLLFPRRWTDGPCAVRVRRSYRCGRRAGHNALGNRWRKWNEKIPGISTIVLVLREPKVVVGSVDEGSDGLVYVELQNPGQQDPDAYQDGLREGSSVVAYLLPAFDGALVVGAV